MSKYNIPPELIQVAFDQTVILEMQQEGVDSFDKIMDKVKGQYTDVLTFLKEKRSTKHSEWDLCRAYYSMNDDYKKDENRVASVFTEYERRGGRELNKERAAMSLPIIFEAVQHQQARIVPRIFGSGPDYIEVMGREQNDVGGAEVYQALANYQQYEMIPTDDLADEFVNNALVEGVGIIARQWDFVRNCPLDEVVPNRLYWFDPNGSDHQQDRWNIWRRLITIGEVKQMYGKLFAYDNDDLVAAQNAGVSDSVDSNQTILQTLNRNMYTSSAEKSKDDHLVACDIFMTAERWVYVINETLVVGIRRNPLVSESNKYHIYPTSVYSPIKAPGNKYGESVVYKMLATQNMSESILYLMHSNFARVVLGMMFGDPSAFDNTKEIRAGKLNAVNDPQKNIMAVQFPDMTGPCMNTLGFLRGIADSISGITNVTRGSMDYSQQTATTTQILQTSSEARLSAMIRRGRRPVKEYYTLGLILNQMYLQGNEVVRIAGKDGLWRPVDVNKDSFTGVSGKDLVISEFPMADSKSWWANSGMNLGSWLLQLKNSGVPVNPTPVFKKVAQANGLVNVQEVFPESAKIGLDPYQENQFLYQGEFLAINPNDDDMWHMQQHQGLLLNPNMQKLAVGNPQLYMPILQHYTLHQQRYSQMAAMNPPPPGGGSGVGTGGTGMAGQTPQAAPKKEGETEKQMEAQKK